MIEGPTSTGDCLYRRLLTSWFVPGFSWGVFSFPYFPSKRTKCVNRSSPGPSLLEEVTTTLTLENLLPLTEKQRERGVLSRLIGYWTNWLVSRVPKSRDEIRGGRSKEDCDDTRWGYKYVYSRGIEVKRSYSSFSLWRLLNNNHHSETRLITRETNK